MGNAGTKSVKKHSNLPGNNQKRSNRGGPVSIPAPPGKPILIPVSAEESTPGIVGICWERSSNTGGSPILGYLVEHQRIGSPHWIQSSPNLCLFPELTFSGLEPGWRYHFRVRAQNCVGLSQPSELSDPLTVSLQRSAASVPSFDLELKDTTTLETDQAEFIVNFSGTPVPKISWFKDGFEIFSSRRTRIITENGKSILLIHQAALSDEGEIKCTATNRAGYASTRANLILEAPPRIRLPRHYEEGLIFEQHETIRLKTFIAGRPTPRVTWFHDSKKIQLDDRHVIEISETGEWLMKIPTAKRTDRGEYTIQAVNKVGEESASFLVTVTDRPSAPGKTIITMTLGRSVTLSWSEPSDDGGCKIGTYIVEYYRIGWDVWLKATTCRQPKTTLSELIEGSEYKFRVKAENPYGVSDPSEESDVIFIPDHKRGISVPPIHPEKNHNIKGAYGGRERKRRIQGQEEKKRTRSLTRDEGNSGTSAAYQTSPLRSVSVQRLTPNILTKPSKADSRVTFSDTVYLHLDDELTDAPVSPVRRKSRRDKSENLSRQEVSKKQIQNIPDLSISPMIITNSSLDGYKNDLNPTEETPSIIPVISNQQLNKEGSDRSEIIYSDDDLDTDDPHGSSEFMLVLYPEVESETPQPLSKYASDGAIADIVEDLVPPPLSRSFPELFSADHQLIEIVREAVSSTELLHERAMEKFFKAVAIEEAEAARKSNSSSNTEKFKSSISSSRKCNNSHFIKILTRRSSVPIHRNGKSTQNQLINDETSSREKEDIATDSLSLTLQSNLSDEDYTSDIRSMEFALKTMQKDKTDDVIVASRDNESTKKIIGPKKASHVSERLKSPTPDKSIVQVLSESDAQSTTTQQVLSSENKPPSVIQPKSILKKHPKSEFVIMPSNTSIFEPQVHGIGLVGEYSSDYKDSLLQKQLELSSKQSLKTGKPENIKEETIMSEVESENTSLMNAAEVAQNRRKIYDKLKNENISSMEEREDFEARKAVVDYYTEVVREHASSHSINARKSQLLRKDQYSKTSNISSTNTSDSKKGVETLPVKITRESPTHGDISSHNFPTNEQKHEVIIGKPKIDKIRNHSTVAISTTSAHSREASVTRSFGKNTLETSPNMILKKEKKRTQSKSSSRASSKERYRSSDMNPSDSETSQKIHHKRRNSQFSERSRKNFYNSTEKRYLLEREFNSKKINEQMVAEANINVRTIVTYTIDLTLLIAATYVYLFKKEILAIPIIGLLLYRRIHEGIGSWIPKNKKH